MIEHRINELRTGALDLPENSAVELENLLGGSGHDPATRLHLPADSTTSEITRSAVESLENWQLLAEHPLTSRPVQVAARGAIRTLEEIIGRVSEGQSDAEPSHR